MNYSTYQYFLKNENESFVEKECNSPVPAVFQEEVIKYSNTESSCDGVSEYFSYFPVFNESGTGSDILLTFARADVQEGVGSKGRYVQSAVWNWSDIRNEMISKGLACILDFSFLTNEDLRQGNNEFGRGSCRHDHIEIVPDKRAISAIVLAAARRWNLLQKKPVVIAVPEKYCNDHYNDYVLSAADVIYSHFPLALKVRAGFTNYLDRKYYSSYKQEYEKFYITFIPERDRDTDTVFLDGSSPDVYDKILKTSTNFSDSDYLLSVISESDRFSERLAGILHDIEADGSGERLSSINIMDYRKYGFALQLIDGKFKYREREAIEKFAAEESSYPEGIRNEVWEYIHTVIPADRLKNEAEGWVASGGDPDAVMDKLCALLKICGSSEIHQDAMRTVFRSLDHADFDCEELYDSISNRSETISPFIGESSLNQLLQTVKNKCLAKHYDKLLAKYEKIDRTSSAPEDINSSLRLLSELASPAELYWRGNSSNKIDDFSKKLNSDISILREKLGGSETIRKEVLGKISGKDYFFSSSFWHDFPGEKKVRLNDEDLAEIEKTIAEEKPEISVYSKEYSDFREKDAAAALASEENTSFRDEVISDLTAYYSNGPLKLSGYTDIVSVRKELEYHKNILRAISLDDALVDFPGIGEVGLNKLQSIIDGSDKSNADDSSLINQLYKRGLVSLPVILQLLHNGENEASILTQVLSGNIDLRKEDIGPFFESAADIASSESRYSAAEALCTSCGTNLSSSIRAYVDKLKSDEDNRKALKAENESLKGENDSLKGDNSSLKDENSSLKDDNSSLKSENTSLKDENISLKGENTSLKNENRSLKGENSSLKSENNSLKDENSSLKSMSNSLKNGPSTGAGDYRVYKSSKVLPIILAVFLVLSLGCTGFFVFRSINAENAFGESEKKLSSVSSDFNNYKETYSWAENKYLLSFDTNGGSSVSPVLVDNGEEVSLSSYVTENGSYFFYGWFSDTELTQRIDTLTISGDTTVHAKWLLDKSYLPKYTLYFDTGFGSSIDPISVPEDSEVNLSEYFPEYEGYTFGGWYTDPTCMEKLNSITVSEDITIYALWEESNGGV